MGQEDLKDFNEMALHLQGDVGQSEHWGRWKLAGGCGRDATDIHGVEDAGPSKICMRTRSGWEKQGKHQKPCPVSSRLAASPNPGVLLASHHGHPFLSSGREKCRDQ